MPKETDMKTERKPVLETERLILRPMRADDDADVIRVLTNARCAETYMLPDYPEPEAARPLFERLRALSLGEGDRLVYGIALKPEKDGERDRLIGYLNEVADKDGKIELGYILHPDCWNRGYMTEALAAVIGELLRVGYAAVVAGYFEENAASGRVMEKCGMELTGEEENIEYRGKTHRCLYREIRRDPSRMKSPRE